MNAFQPPMALAPWARYPRLAQRRVAALLAEADAHTTAGNYAAARDALQLALAALPISNAASRSVVLLVSAAPACPPAPFSP